MNYHVIRLIPGEGLLSSLENYLHHKEVEAGCIFSVVGSLRYATIRLANQGVPSTLSGKFEIVSLSGNITAIIVCLIIQRLPKRLKQLF